MTFFCFVRHGQTDQNKLGKIQGQLDFPLNSKGIEDANSLGKYLKEKNINFDYIITSPLDRAYQTGKIIGEYLDNRSIIVDERFIERCFGCCEGLDATDETFVHIIDNTAEGLEKSYDLEKRVIGAIKDLALKYPNKRILIVSHSHTIKALTSSVLPGIHKLSDKLSNCSLTSFVVEEDKIKILKYNEKVI